ncbi:D-alanine--D-alanine ligase [Patiriisocius hiemis]|uniref:D-alanine--D-alanine ligase n=1 Tax=Patiriisocius hiemis TaxID=3075604 RepID=A0ABU2YGC5_9FLAO|nr:D-alanine--D-alanine ligase [Constantimarinum sp. W242]MDT0556832.1 D-alanine--D-alanine ligase [Constantimarinum sp. W242]
MSKKNVFVVMGGYGSEYKISLESGSIVCEALQNSNYTIYPIHILETGWDAVINNTEKYPINKADFSFTTPTETIRPDVVFNTIHGTPGEDGYLAAYLTLLKIPQTSANLYEAALSFNKRDCLSVLKNFGIKCANSYYINKGITIKTEEIIKIVGLPCFVKPNRSGSSFGISKVNIIEELAPAIEKAFKEDHEVLIETALIGTEVSIGTYTKNDTIFVFAPTEIVSENEFFDYEAKYLGQSQEITPARISDEETKRVQTEAKKIHALLNLKGVARSEFILQNGIPYFIEINTAPGLSSESIIPKQVRHAGMTLSSFFEILINNTLS